jgi:hypothetical protein
MTGDRLRSLYDAQPFRPFVIHLADRRALPVQHREFLALSPTGGTAVVFQPDDSFNIVDVILVTDLEVKANGAPHQ